MNLEMLDTLRLVVFLLVLGMVDASFVNLPDAINFFHEYTTKEQVNTLHSTNLEDERMVKWQDALLADPMVGISTIYYSTCSQGISAPRALKILEWAEKWEDKLGFEERWLGVNCLSPAILEARVARKKWPPVQIPLLVEGLSLTNIPITSAYQLLEMALKEPKLWYSMDWALQANWQKMPLHLWRMATLVNVGLYGHTMQSMRVIDYATRVLLSTENHRTIHDVEELFIKTIRLIRLARTSKLSTRRVFLLPEMGALLGKFEGIKREHSWVGRVLDTLAQLISPVNNMQSFLSALSKSELLNIHLWPKAIGREMATNDLLEIFTLIFDLTKDHQEVAWIERSLQFFLQALDPSLAIPVVMRAFVGEVGRRPTGEALLRKFCHGWTNDNRLFRVLYDLLPTGPRQLEAMQLMLKANSYPLKDRLYRYKGANPIYDPDAPLIDRLDNYWTRMGKQWPGFLMAYEPIRPNLEGLFIPCQEDPGTFDPVLQWPQNTDWKWIFMTIRFEIKHRIPNRFVLSKCFIAALFNRKDHGGTPVWEELRGKFPGCSFPVGKIEQGRYQQVLREAAFKLGGLLDLVRISGRTALQAAMRGYIMSELSMGER